MLREWGRSPNGANEARPANPLDVRDPWLSLWSFSHLARRRSRLEGDAIAQYLVDASQQQPCHHNASDLLPPPFRRAFVGSPVTRDLPRPHRGFDQVVPQVLVRAATADPPVTPGAIRFVQS